MPLSHREHQILKCMAVGWKNAKIAYELGMSEQTVKNHITNIMKAFFADNRTQAVTNALKIGYLKMEDL